MMTFTLTWDRELSGAPMRQLMGLLSNPTELNAILEVAAEDVVKSHLTDNYSTRVNSLGAPSTGYWKRAIEGTTSESSADGITVKINQIGVRLKYHGGVIHPTGRISEVTGKPIKYLSIPVHPAAHGRTIADLGGKRTTYHHDGGIYFKAGSKPSASDPLYYVLKKSVRINADPNILPPDGAILNGCMRALEEAIPQD